MSPFLPVNEPRFSHHRAGFRLRSRGPRSCSSCSSSDVECRHCSVCFSSCCCSSSISLHHLASSITPTALAVAPAVAIAANLAVDGEASDDEGSSPLHYAAQNQHDSQSLGDRPSHDCCGERSTYHDGAYPFKQLCEDLVVAIALALATQALALALATLATARAAAAAAHREGALTGWMRS